MRKVLGIIAASLFTLAFTGSAQALVLNASGDASIQIATLDPIVLPGTLTVTVNGSGGAVGGHITSITIPGSPFATTGFRLDVTDPGANPIQGLQATAHVGTVAGTPGAGLLGGINGVTKVCLFADCSGFVPANVSVPVTVIGQGGTAAVSSFVNVTVTGAPWTTGTVNIGSITQMGFAHGPASATSSTAAPSGVISLVTPIFISTNIGASAALPGFAFLNLHIVPEPGTLLLLGSGVVGMGLLGRRKLRK